jgi:hypothetical protein
MFKDNQGGYCLLTFSRTGLGSAADRPQAGAGRPRRRSQGTHGPACTGLLHVANHNPPRFVVSRYANGQEKWQGMFTQKLREQEQLEQEKQEEKKRQQDRWEQEKRQLERREEGRQRQDRRDQGRLEQEKSTDSDGHLAAAQQHHTTPRPRKHQVRYSLSFLSAGSLLEDSTPLAQEKSDFWITFKVRERGV